MKKTQIFHHALLFLHIIFILPVFAQTQWSLLQHSIGITAMHMQLLHDDHILIYDRTDFGPSNLSLPSTHPCRHDPTDIALKIDCTAHSILYHVLTNTFRPLSVQTDVWCSSGAVLPDGTLFQAGGYLDGAKKVRLFTPCEDSTCDWREIDGALGVKRWYATSCILPEGNIIIVGGRRQFSYEFYPKTPLTRNVYSLRFLVETFDKGAENNLYPFVILNVDGNLFIFANNRAILFSYKDAIVLRTYPVLPSGVPRSYPSTGSAVLLPVKNMDLNPNRNLNTLTAEVLVCGGAPAGAYKKAQNGFFLEAVDTCGRMKITDPNPRWEMDIMPFPRVMGDMILLPNGDILIINGGSKGTAGWEYGRDPVLHPVLYKPYKKHGSRFEIQNPTSIPRMYHSSAVLLRDGRVVVGGNNPHIFYNFTGVLYPTDLSLEAFSPPYLDLRWADIRPRMISPISQTRVGYGQWISVRFWIQKMDFEDIVKVTLMAPSFATHSFSMNQRLVVIGEGKAKSVGISVFEMNVRIPGSSNVAPPGYYLLFIVYREIPGEGVWIHIGKKSSRPYKKT